ncbi:hypothetical protein WR25_13528 [Diploscapter pachys]|uniref:Uncharacterized protein n=1 Tax=Diploscapter pachys TaxID=2018661 RepID=A0A2A2KFX8_9BILA|nr:hypothetical protein WR25_13528 [Diploscapter pachys]
MTWGRASNRAPYRLVRGLIGLPASGAAWTMPLGQLLQGVDDQPVYVPAPHAVQVQTFVGACQANLLLVCANFLGQTQGDLASIEQLPLLDAGVANQFLADCGRQLREYPPDDLGAWLPSSRKTIIGSGEFAKSGAADGAVTNCLVQPEALHRVFQQGRKPLILDQGPAQFAFVNNRRRVALGPERVLYTVVSGCRCVFDDVAIAHRIQPELALVMPEAQCIWFQMCLGCCGKGGHQCHIFDDIDQIAVGNVAFVVLPGVDTVVHLEGQLGQAKEKHRLPKPWYEETGDVQAGQHASEDQLAMGQGGAPVDNFGGNGVVQRIHLVTLGLLERHHLLKPMFERHAFVEATAAPSERGQAACEAALYRGFVAFGDVFVQVAGVGPQSFAQLAEQRVQGGERLERRLIIFGNIQRLALLPICLPSDEQDAGQFGFPEGHRTEGDACSCLRSGVQALRKRALIKVTVDIALEASKVQRLSECGDFGVAQGSIHIQCLLIGAAPGRGGGVVDGMHQVMVSGADIQGAAQVGEGFGGEVYLVGDGYGAHEAAVIDDDGLFQRGSGRVHAMLLRSASVEIVQCAVQQRAGCPVDCLATING